MGGPDDEQNPRPRKGAKNVYEITSEDKAVIKKLDNPSTPGNTVLTNAERESLRKVLENVLQKSLPNNSNPLYVRDNVLRALPRFRFVDQVPGARERIATELAKYGLEP